MKRPDSQAIIGLLAVAAMIAAGALVLIGLGHEVPPEAWAIVSGALGAVGGWVGKTLTAETPTPAPEPAPEVELTPMGNVVP